MQVIQGKAEPFVDFLEHLTQAVHAQTEGLKFQNQLLTELARSGVNEACKAVIRALPLDPPPTLDQMVEACVKSVTLNHGNSSSGSSGQSDQSPWKVSSVWKAGTLG